MPESYEGTPVSGTMYANLQTEKESSLLVSPDCCVMKISSVTLSDAASLRSISGNLENIVPAWPGRVSSLIHQPRPGSYSNQPGHAPRDCKVGTKEDLL